MADMKETGSAHSVEDIERARRKNRKRRELYDKFDRYGEMVKKLPSVLQNPMTRDEADPVEWRDHEVHRAIDGLMRHVNQVLIYFEELTDTEAEIMKAIARGDVDPDEGDGSERAALERIAEELEPHEPADGAWKTMADGALERALSIARAALKDGGK